jgi:histidinol dehydrogenase
MQILKLTEEAFGSILTNMLERSPDSYPEQEAQVAAILADVKKRGDEAVFEYTRRFDKAEISADNFIVSKEEEEEANTEEAPAENKE